MNFRVTFEPMPNVLLPYVARMELDEKTYGLIEQWTSDSDLYLTDQASGLELVCQLNTVPLTVAPENSEKEFALYVLVHAWPAGPIH